jgi:hypothetical protein
MSGRLGLSNARDIRHMLQGNTDPKLIKILADLAERQDHLYQLLGQMAHAMDTLASTQMAVTRATEVLKDEHDRIKRARSAGVKVETEVDRDANE